MSNETQQTDMERFIAFYASVGIALEAEKWRAPIAPRSHEIGDVLVVELKGNAEKVGGQYDTWAVFDEQGKFLYQWAGC